MSSQHGESEDVVAQCFVLPKMLGTEGITARVLAQTKGLPEAHAAIASAYQSTLERLNTTTLLPYRMAWLGEANVQQQRLSQVATIKALDQLDPFKDDLDEKTPALRDKIAIDLFREFLGSEVGRDALSIGAARRLEWSTRLDKGRMMHGARDLLLQSVIAAWAAFEAYISDTIHQVLNERPETLRLLLANEEAKRRVSKTRWSVSELLDFGLDLSGRFADLVLAENDLSDYASIKAILVPLFDNPTELIEALNDRTVFTLSRLRNLLVHRSGIADTRLERETAGRWKAGEPVAITPQDLADFVRVTARVVELIVVELRQMFHLPPIVSPT